VMNMLTLGTSSRARVGVNVRALIKRDGAEAYMCARMGRPDERIAGKDKSEARPALHCVHKRR
jgi:hypothetical protein